MHNALSGIAQAKDLELMGARVVLQGGDHAGNIWRARLATRGRIMIHHREGQRRFCHGHPPRGDLGKGVV